MPQIKLNIGPMSLEGDETSKGDGVLAHLYNGYRATTTDGSKAIHSIPGYSQRCDLGVTSTIDGDWYSILHNYRLVASDGRIWKITNGVHPNLTATELTTAELIAGKPVSFTEDENYIYFCGGMGINRVNPADGSITQLAGQSPINCTHLAYLKGYLIAKGDDVAGGGIPGDVWYSSSVGSYATWNVFNNMARPDDVSAIFATFKEIYAVGRETTEVSYATTDPSAPFASNDGATQPFGTQAPYSVAFDGQSIYFMTTIGDNRVVCRLINGREPQQISFAVGVPIDDAGPVSDARGWIQSWAGQSFYVLQLPSARVTVNDQVHNGITLVFNIKLQEWHIWYEWDETTNECLRYPADTFLYHEPSGRRFIGYKGKLWEQTDDSLYLGTVPIRASIRTGNVSWNKPGQFKVANYYAYQIKRGVAAGTPEPVMIHRWRNDGNAEWSMGRTVSMGTVGERTLNIKSSQCGRYRTRQHEFIFPDPVAVVFDGVVEDVELLK